MKLTIILEQHFFYDGSSYWTDYQCDSKFWDRYLEVFDELIICSRVADISEAPADKKLLLSDRENVTFIPLPNFRGPLGLLKNGIKCLKILHRAISYGDCVLTRIPSPISLLATPALIFSRKPFATEFVVNPKTAFSTDSIKTKVQPLVQWVFVHDVSILMKCANGVSYVTEEVLQNAYPCRAILEGSSKQYFTAHYSTIQLSRRDYVDRNLTPQRPKLLSFVHVGTMGDSRKGQDIFIRTIEILRTDGYNVVGTLVGDGPKRDELQNMSKQIFGTGQKVINFVGWKSGFSEVQAELSKHDFFLFPSASEGLPRAMIEAMASGLIGVGYDVDGMSELLDEFSLVKERSAEAFAQKIEAMLNQWPRTMEYQTTLFKRSLKFENSLLSKRRTAFYSKLKLLAISKQGD